MTERLVVRGSFYLDPREDLAQRTSIGWKRNPAAAISSSCPSSLFLSFPFPFPPTFSLADFNCPGRKGGCHVRKACGGAEGIGNS